MDQVGIDFEWHRGAQFHQGKRAGNTIRFAMIPAAANGQNRLSVQTEIETRSRYRSQTRTPRSRLDMNLNHEVQSESNSDLDSPYMYSNLYLAYYFVV